MNTGWLLAGFVPHSTTRSLSITSCSEQVDAATPIDGLQADRGRRVAHARGGVDAGDAHGPRRLARHVVRLVRDAAARQVERDPLGVGARRCAPASASSASSHGDAAEPGLAAAAAHRVREPAELAQLGGAERREGVDVGEQTRGRAGRPC